MWAKNVQAGYQGDLWKISYVKRQIQSANLYDDSKNLNNF